MASRKDTRALPSSVEKGRGARAESGRSKGDGEGGGGEEVTLIW